MCQHNDDDYYHCLKCCYEVGYEDGIMGIWDCQYKDIDQCNEYADGYEAGVARINRMQITFNFD